MKTLMLFLHLILINFVGSNGIPTKMLKILKNDISCQLFDIFDTSFSSGVLLSILKITKVIPIHKKDSKLF